MSTATEAFEQAARPTAGRAADPHTPTLGQSNRDVRLETFFSPEERYHMIAQSAYHRAESRGFEPGHEFDDWQWAEHEVDSACGLLEPGPRWDLACSE